MANVKWLQLQARQVKGARHGCFGLGDKLDLLCGIAFVGIVCLDITKHCRAVDNALNGHALVLVPVSNWSLNILHRPLFGCDLSKRMSRRTKCFVTLSVLPCTMQCLLSWQRMFPRKQACVLTQTTSSPNPVIEPYQQYATTLAQIFWKVDLNSTTTRESVHIQCDNFLSERCVDMANVNTFRR